MQQTWVYPWVGGIPWMRKWQPTPVFWPGESHGQRSLAGYSPWGCRVRHDRATEQQQQTRLQGQNVSADEAFPLSVNGAQRPVWGCVGPHFSEMLMGFHTLFLGGEHPLYSVYNLNVIF